MTDARLLATGVLAACAALATALDHSPETARAQSPGGGRCLTAEAPPNDAPPNRLRFGITPQLAGTVGEGQGSVVPDDPASRMAALRALKPARRDLVVRLNRLFLADGPAGIADFERRAHRYERAGFGIESQVRYHPRPDQEGDIDRWLGFVRHSARALGRVEALVELSITNEVNLPLSANTSDGAYDGAIEALVRGVIAARAELDRIGRGDVAVGFTYAYRYFPDADAEFWHSIGELGGPRFRRALDHVGVQLYPGLFWPPVLITQSAGEATIEALTLIRECWMPMASLGRRIGVWISENGYATNLGHTEARQAAELADTIELVHSYSGTLGVSDYRYFNLRDNEPNGTDLFDNVGLLRADYSRKPAFDVFRDLIKHFGARG